MLLLPHCSRGRFAAAVCVNLHTQPLHLRRLPSSYPRCPVHSRRCFSSLQWCGHCKSLAPEYEKLGKNFASVSSIVIAKMDATANEVDHPSVNIKGFPTILFFPATEAGQAKKVVEYDGSRDIEGFTAFLKKNAVKPFTLAAASEDDEEL